jgi:hypothetical protein
MPESVQTPDKAVRVLRSVEGVPGNSVRNIAAAEVIDVFLVWIILHEKSLYPYHSQRVQALTPTDHHARVAFCQWIVEKYLVKTQFEANILFTHEAGFTMDGLKNFHNTHVWIDDNPHIKTSTTIFHQYLGWHLR